MTSLLKIISFPSNATVKYKCCIPTYLSVYNTSVRNPGPPPGFGGFHGELLQLLVDNLGISFDYYIPQFGFGYRDEQNRYTGCTGMVQKGEVDFSILEISEYWRSLFAHISVPYMYENFNFVTKRPDPVTAADVIIKCFQPKLWISILMAIFLMAFVWYWIQGRRYSFADQLFSRYAELVLQEPIAKIKRVFSEEILCLFWSTGVQFLPLAYMAVILGVMMLPRRPPSIDDDEKLLDAVKHGKYKPIYNANIPSIVHFMVQNGSKSVHQELGRIMIEKDWKMIINTKNYAELLKSGHAVAMITTSHKIHKLREFETVVSKDDILFDLAVAVASRSWPHIEKFDISVRRLHEHGILEAMYDRYIFKYRLKNFRNDEPESNDVRAINFMDLQGPFISLGIGLGLSTIAFFYEVISAKTRKKIEQRKKRHRRKAFTQSMNSLKVMIYND